MNFKPLENKLRIEVVDALRGLALLGVLIANIPFSDQVSFSGRQDSIMTFLHYLLIDKKFITIFSLLFGFGFYMQYKRVEKKINFTKYFTFRMLLLFIIGTLHTYILWNGDILRAYALGGILLILFRNWPVKKLVIIAVLFNVVFTGITYIGNSIFGWREYNYDYSFAAELPLTTSYFRYLYLNAVMDPWVNFMKDIPITLFFTFGNMIVGLIFAKIDFFNLPEKLNKFTTIIIIQGLSIGLASSFIYYKVSVGEIEFGLSLAWMPFFLLVGMISQSLMYISVFVRLYQVNPFKRLFHFFTLVGKTALSNYIFQSVFYLVVFYHCTQLFQLFGKLTVSQTYLLAILFFIIQTSISYLFLRNNSQGPLEILWKKWSYKIANK